MSNGLTIDDSQWRDAVVKMQEATGRCLADCLNSMGKDVALRAMQFTKKADMTALENYRESIYANWTNPLNGKTHSAPIWCLYISKRLRKTGVSIQYVGVRKISKSGKKMMGSFKALAGGGSAWTKAEARAASAKILSARHKTFGFLRAGFIPAALAFWEAEGKTGILRISTNSINRNDLRYGGVPKGGYKLAVPSEAPSAEMSNSAVSKGKYSSKKGTGETALTQFAGKALEDAVSFVAQDKLDWAERHFEKEFRKFMG